MNSINIDIGGTFTDCYMLYNDLAVSSKAPTTHYDLTTGLTAAIEKAAETLGLSISELLEKTEIIKYSTTLAMNALLERKGAKLGLLTTAGFEDTTLIGRGSQWHECLPLELKRNPMRGRRPVPLVPRDMIIGVRERVDCFGNVRIPLDEQDILRAVQQLVDQGAMGFVVNYLWSFVNPEHELRTREIIEREYPDFYLGSHLVVLSHEVLAKKNEYERGMTAILEGYLHRNMFEEITALNHKLIDLGYQKPLFMVHNSGGMAPSFRTTAVQSYNSGPCAAIEGAAYQAEQYGLGGLVVTDMGGTSFDIAVVPEGGKRFYSLAPLIDWWRVGFSVLESKSIGAGGGSIGWINPIGQTLEVGPKSAGSMPGPACYDQGGEEATVTDADMILGYINPDNFLAGRMILNREQAYEIVKRKVAEPLGVDVVEAALAMKRIVDANMGNEIFKEVQLKGFDPREMALIAAGGGGPTHCCGYANFAEISPILVFPFSAVFSAYGVSVMDIIQIYERTQYIKLHDPIRDELFSDYEQFNSLVELLKSKAMRDLKDEALSHDKIRYTLELDMRYGQQPNVVRVRVPKTHIASEADVKELIDEFTRTYSRLYTPASTYPQGGVEIFNFYLMSTVETVKSAAQKFTLSGESAKDANIGQRQVYWESVGFQPTNIFDVAKLRAGNVVRGPAVVEAPDTTYVIPADRVMKLDQYLNGFIDFVEGEKHANRFRSHKGIPAVSGL